MTQTFRYSKGDVRIAFLLGLCLFFLAALQLNGGQSLANDAGAYMNTALAISEGRMEEQDRLNLLMHPSPLSFVGEEAESLTYSWGYPLLLALVHRFAGFDTTAFDTIIFYKLPVAAAYALLGAVMYLFCRRRFSAAASIALSALLMLNPLLMEQLNVISPELPFLLFFLLSLLTAETYAASPGMRKGILLGFWLFCCCVVRLNGISVIFIVLLIHVLSRNRSPGHRAFRIAESTPYLSCGLFFLVSLLFLPQPTSNLSDVGQVRFRYFQQNLFSYYPQILSEWMQHLIPLRHAGEWMVWEPLAVIVSVFVLLGVIRCGLKRELPYLIVILATLLMVSFLSYRQGLRYVYTILPLLLLFMGHGFQWLGSLVKRRFWRACRTGVIGLCSAALVLQTAVYAAGLYRAGDTMLPPTDAYSAESIGVYRYIQQNTPEDCAIAYFRPRVLYLNTGRFSFKPEYFSGKHSNMDHYFLEKGPYTRELLSADYLLLHNNSVVNRLDYVQSHIQEPASLRLVYQNDVYELYEIIQ